MMSLNPAFTMLSATSSLTRENVSAERFTVPGKRLSSVVGAKGMTGETSALPELLSDVLTEVLRPENVLSKRERRTGRFSAGIED